MPASVHNWLYSSMKYSDFRVPSFTKGLRCDKRVAAVIFEEVLATRGTEDISEKGWEARASGESLAWQEKEEES